MATKKISELSTTTTPSSSALFPIVQSSDNFAVTLANIAANLPDVTATTLTSSGTTTATGGFVGNLTGNVTGNLTGTASAATLAASATALATGRTIALTGDVTYTSGSFDGTGNVTGTASIGSGVIVNDDVNSSAALAFSKMENLTASRALVSDGSGDVSVSAVTSTEIGYLDGVTSGIQTQLDGKASSTYVPTTITIADESTDTTCFPLFVTAATGDLGPKTASGLTFNSNTDVLSGTFSGNITGNVTGNTSGSSGSCTGNAATATALETARNIGGVSFDGTGNINLPGVNTSGNQDTSGTAAIATTVTVADESSDTSCNVLFTTAATGNLAPKSGTNLTFNSDTGALTATSFSGNLTGNVTGNTSGSSGSTTGNAATATALETARNIGGVSFDGTGNIDLPGVNSAGNQNTSGTAAGLSATLAVGSGGTGATSLTANGALIGNGTSAVTSVDMSTKGHLLVGDGSGNPSALSVGTNTHVLTADSSEATGLKWAAASGQTRINSQPLLINGAMQINQRGSKTGVTTDQYYAADRWRTNINSYGAYTISESTDVPTGYGFAKSFKIDCTTADASPASGDLFTFEQRMEGNNLQLIKKGTSNAETLTLAFWIKSNLTGNFTVNLVDQDNSRRVGALVTISSANTWEKKVLSFAADTTGALGNDNGDSFRVQFFLGVGSSFTSGTLPSSWESATTANFAAGQTAFIGSSTSNEVFLTGLQLEIGTYTSATIPEFLFENEETLTKTCQRYYYKQGDDGSYAPLGSGVCENTSSAYIIVDLPTQMRTTPSVSFTGNITLFDGDTFNTSSSLASKSNGTEKVRLSVTANSSVANGNGATLHVENSSSYVEFDSEI